jgi:hypothetical protein
MVRPTLTPVDDRDPPPAYPAYPPPPYAPPAPRWYNPTGLARAIRILLGVVAVVLFLNVLGILYVRSVAVAFVAGDRSDDEFFAAVVLFFLLALAFFAGQIATGVCTIIWQWRLTKNTQLMGRPGARWGPGWAISGWLIPFANIVLPFLQLRELWKAADWRYPPNSTDWKLAPIGTALVLWQVTWVGMTVLQFALNFSGNVGPSSTSDAEIAAARELADLIGLAIPSYLVGVAAAVLFLIVVQQLTERHAHAAALAAAGRLGADDGY